MLAQIRRFNESAGEELITLKIGAHVGPCLAVTLNERLDYFGRTVNLAARAGSGRGERDLSERRDVPPTRLRGLVGGAAVRRTDRPRQRHPARDRRSRIARLTPGPAATLPNTAINPVTIVDHKFYS
jgi:class 3 adenylate cyclase